jgi:hypothetical protein
MWDLCYCRWVPEWSEIANGVTAKVVYGTGNDDSLLEEMHEKYDGKSGVGSIGGGATSFSSGGVVSVEETVEEEEMDGGRVTSTSSSRRSQVVAFGTSLLVESPLSSNVDLSIAEEQDCVEEKDKGR